MTISSNFRFWDMVEIHLLRFFLKILLESIIQKNTKIKQTKIIFKPKGTDLDFKKCDDN